MINLYVWFLSVDLLMVLLIKRCLYYGNVINYVDINFFIWNGNRLFFNWGVYGNIVVIN